MPLPMLPYRLITSAAVVLCMAHAWLVISTLAPYCPMPTRSDSRTVSLRRQTSLCRRTRDASRVATAAVHKSHGCSGALSNQRQTIAGNVIMAETALSQTAFSKQNAFHAANYKTCASRATSNNVYSDRVLIEITTIISE